MHYTRKKRQQSAWVAEVGTSAGVAEVGTSAAGMVVAAAAAEGAATA